MKKKESRRVQWQALSRDYVGQLTDAEKELLEAYEVMGMGMRPKKFGTLLDAFQGKISKRSPRKARPPLEDPWRRTLWRFIDQDSLGRWTLSLRATSEDEELQYWRVAFEDYLVHITIPVGGPNRFPRFLVLEPLKKKFTLTRKSVKWDKKTHSIPCLSKLIKVGLPVPMASEKVEEKGRVTSVLYEFTWRQGRPIPHLRYVFLREQFAIFCLSYQ